MTRWTATRLQRLFRKYNRRFWKNKLPEYPVIIDSTIDAMGLIFFKEKRIKLNLREHTTDATVRSTLLHEMAHLAVGKVGHNSLFFLQMERLLRQKAPITVGFPENQNRINLDSVPGRFALCRRALARPYARKRRSIEAYVKRRGVRSFDLKPKHIEREYEDAASLQDLTWKVVLANLEREYGVLDIDGKVLKWAKPYVEAGHRGFRRGRRWYLQHLKDKDWFLENTRHDRQ